MFPSSSSQPESQTSEKRYTIYFAFQETSNIIITMCFIFQSLNMKNSCFKKEPTPVQIFKKITKQQQQQQQTQQLMHWFIPTTRDWRIVAKVDDRVVGSTFNFR